MINKILRASERNRTVILWLEAKRTNRCATLAWTGHCDITVNHPRCDKEIINMKQLNQHISNFPSLPRYNVRELISLW